MAFIFMCYAKFLKWVARPENCAISWGKEEEEEEGLYSHPCKFFRNLGLLRNKKYSSFPSLPITSKKLQLFYRKKQVRKWVHLKLLEATLLRFLTWWSTLRQETEWNYEWWSIGLLCVWLRRLPSRIAQKLSSILNEFFVLNFFFTKLSNALISQASHSLKVL